MSSIAGSGCERIIPEEAKKTLEEILLKDIESQYGLNL